MLWENGIETCILSYVKWIASPDWMHDTGCSGLVHWDDPEGWNGEGGGRGDQDGKHMYTVADLCQCMTKLIQYFIVISQENINNLSERNEIQLFCTLNLVNISWVCTQLFTFQTYHNKVV